MAKDPNTSFFGHPAGLKTLFFTEMWERFSYYGMRAILVLFMTTAVIDGGLGFTKAEAAIVYGLYTSMVYLLPLLGGWLADNVLGMRRAVFTGGVVIMIGHILLAMHGIGLFYAGLAFVAMGTGLLKPNISALVGQLYTENDRRRDSGFSIYYMGINIGAFTAPIACGWLAQHDGFKSILQGWGITTTQSWHWGFGAAAVGMFFGLIQYLLTARNLGSAGVSPAGAMTPESKANARRKLNLGLGVLLGLVAVVAGIAMSKPDLMTKENINVVYRVILFGSVIGFFAWLLKNSGWTPIERRKLIVVTVLFVGSCAFWGAFEQAGNTLTLFAEEKTHNSLAGFDFPSSWWQSVNAVLIVLLAPAFAWLWTRLGDFDRSSMIRFSFGIFFAGLGFAVLIGGANAAEGATKASPMWLFTVYFCHTIGELCLSPVGLSSMTKLAPQRVQGLMLGVWFLSISVGTYLGSEVASVYEKFELPTLFAAVAAVTILVSIIMAILIKPVSKLVDKPS